MPAPSLPRPRRRFGQNFLVDRRTIASLIRAFAPAPGEVVIEIGPGRGALTGPLLAAGARVTVVEIDRDLAGALARALDEPEALRVVEGDALDIDLDRLARDAAAPSGRPARLIANLPYNVATAILRRVLAAHAIASAQVMVQDEVADRLTAEAGEGAYGPLGVLCALRGGARRLFRIGPGAFRPRPRVVSAVVRLDLPEDAAIGPDDVGPLEAFLHRAFAGRRKTLANNLRAGGLPPDRVASVLDRIGLDRSVRAETVPPSLWPVLRAAFESLVAPGGTGGTE